MITSPHFLMLECYNPPHHRLLALKWANLVHSTGISSHFYRPKTFGNSTVIPMLAG